MKKSLLALAVLGAFASAASAQSSVTLSGSVDAGIRRVGTATGRDWLMTGSTSSYNRFILSGSEDMGGGMRALFWLEHRFRINDGTVNSPTNAGDGSVFWRRSYVGLAGGFGELRLGRQDMPLQAINGDFDIWGTGFMGSHTGGINATVRANNAINYRTPNFGGLTLQAGIAAGEGQNQGANGQGEVGGGLTSAFTPSARLNSERPIGVALNYSAGPLRVAVAYDRNAADLDTVGLYATYDFGVFKVNGQFEKGDNCTSVTTTCTTNAVRGANGAVTTNGKDDVTVYAINAQAPLGPIVAKVGFARVDSDLNNGDGSKVTVGADYVLSKRTNLYTNATKASGNRFSTARKKAAFDVGVTHRF